MPQAVRDEDYNLKALDKWGVRTSNIDVVVVDEAQVLSFDELIEIASLCISMDKGLICVSQVFESLPCKKLQKILDDSGRNSIHVELEGFDKVNMSPEKIAVKNRLINRL